MHLPRFIRDLVIRTAGTGRRTPAGRCDVTNGTAAEIRDPDYVHACQLTTNEAAILLERFKVRGLRFDIESDHSAPAENTQGGYQERRTMALHVHREDADEADALIKEWLHRDSGIRV